MRFSMRFSTPDSRQPTNRAKIEAMENDHEMKQTRNEMADSAKTRQRAVCRRWGAVATVVCLFASGQTAGQAISLSTPVPRDEYLKPEKLCDLDCDNIVESSGLAASRVTPGVFWTHNDSGNPPRLFAFDEEGKHLGTSKVTGADLVDWEDMASFMLDDEPCLLVADVGDNERRRGKYQLYLFEEMKPKSDGLRPRQIVTFRYERGAVDCESVGFDAMRREVLLVEKLFQLSCDVYVLKWPAGPTDDTLVAKQVGTVNVPCAVSMDVSPDGKRAMILSYLNAYEYVRRDREDWKQAFAREGREVRMPERRQGETLCYGLDGRTLFLTSEKRPTPLFRVTATRGK